MLGADIPDPLERPFVEKGEASGFSVEEEVVGFFAGVGRGGLPLMTWLLAVVHLLSPSEAVWP